MENEKIINYQLLWERITDYVKTVGRIGARPILLLYYVLKSKDTPKSDKVLIASALSYLVFPIDLISAKRLPVIGWVDELLSLTIVYKKMCKYITPKIELEVDAVLEKWFPESKLVIIQ